MNTILIFMACVSLLAVGRAARKLIANRKHLTGAEFRDYMKGGRTMSDDERSRVTSHLGICDECQRQVEDWIKGDTEDSLVQD